VFFGAAAGVGKTRAMLDEAHRLADHGTDVIVGYVELHRPGTEAHLAGLDVVPRRIALDGGHRYEEFDVDAALARRPRVVLVDEYAHTNAPGGRNERRWQDVEDLLDAGIDVLTTLNVQHLESLKDVVEGITDVPQRETVPDAVVRAANQVVVVDMTPEALRRRISDEEPGQRADQALAHYFQLGNLTALRALALQWVADRAGDRLRRYQQAQGIAGPWETHERVVVLLTGAPAPDEALLRRAARLGARSGAELIAVRIQSDDGLARDPELLEHQRALSESLGGRLVELYGSDVAETLVTFAQMQRATQLVLERQGRRWALLAGLERRVARQAGPIDVHLVSTSPEDDTPPRRRGLVQLPWRRQLVAWLLVLVATPALAIALIPVRGTQLGLAVVLLVLLLEVVVVALAGGIRPALGAAVAAFGLTDWFFVTPIHSLRIAHADDLAILAIFFVVAVLVSAQGSRLARRGHEARRARVEADALAQLATVTVSPDAAALDRLLEPLRSALDLDGVAVVARAPGTPSGWRVDAHVGTAPLTSPDTAEVSVPLTHGQLLLASARALPAVDREVLEAFGLQLRRTQERVELQADATEASVRADASRLRHAILTSVSHDLRTPLASIKGAATSLLSPEVDWSGEAVRSFLEMIDQEADRLNRTVSNLLDLSRLQAGHVDLQLRPVELADAVGPALRDLHRDVTAVATKLGTAPLAVTAEPTALQHVIANLVDNALTWSPPGGPIEMTATREGDAVRLLVVDHGPGIPVERRADVLAAFQRLADHATDRATGIGLGLAVANGLTEEMGGSLVLDDTPGGGTTVVVTLPAAPTPGGAP
jgi:two-component system sensor histidine kinase KdpD